MVKSLVWVLHCTCLPSKETDLKAMCFLCNCLNGLDTRNPMSTTNCCVPSRETPCFLIPRRPLLSHILVAGSQVCGVGHSQVTWLQNVLIMVPRFFVHCHIGRTMQFATKMSQKQDSLRETPAFLSTSWKNCEVDRICVICVKNRQTRHGKGNFGSVCVHASVR